MTFLAHPSFFVSHSEEISCEGRKAEQNDPGTGGGNTVRNRKPSSFMDFPFLCAPSQNLPKPRAQGGSCEEDHSHVGLGKRSSPCQPTAQAWPWRDFQNSERKERTTYIYHQSLRTDPASPWPSPQKGGNASRKTNSVGKRSLRACSVPGLAGDTRPSRRRELKPHPDPRFVWPWPTRWTWTFLFDHHHLPQSGFSLTSHLSLTNFPFIRECIQPFKEGGAWTN